MRPPPGRLLPLLALVLSGAPDLASQETARTFCREGGAIECIPDSLEVVFRSSRSGESSIIEMDEFVPGLRVDASMVLDTRTPGIQGFLYAVRHDIEFLVLQEGSVTHEGTIIDPDHPQTVLVDPFFSAITVVDGGYAVAMVLSLLQPTELPVGRRTTLNHASYRLVGDPGAAGTRIAVADEISIDGRFVPTVFTVNTQSKLPATVADGLIRRPARPRFIRGDADGDGGIDISDAVLLLRILIGLRPASYDCTAALDADGDSRTNLSDAVFLLQFLFRGRSAPPAPFPRCGTGGSSGAPPSCSEPAPSCGM